MIRSLLLTGLHVLLAIVPTVAQEATPRTSVRGQGGYILSDDPDGVLLDSVSINAWLDGAGKAHGTVAWTSLYHGYYEPGPASSGYPWLMEVTDLVVQGNQAFVEAIVVSSPQAPDDEGIRGRFLIMDHGNGVVAADDLGALLEFEPGNFVPALPLGPIGFGNFTVHSAP